MGCSFECYVTDQSFHTGLKWHMLLFIKQTLERSYLLKINGKIAERPQHMYMRVAVGIHGEDIDAAIEVMQI